MINKIFKRTSALVLIAVFTLQSCQDDFVNLQPEFALDAVNNPSSMEQLEQVLDGAYANFRAADYYGSGSGTGGGAALMPDVMSDNLYETLLTLANSRDMSNFQFQQNTGQITAIYNAMYKVVSVANIVLRDVDKFTTPANKKTANRIKGQAFAIRALAHFDLFKYFAENYDRNSTTTLALHYSKNFEVSSDAKPVRLSNKVYYDELFSDLNSAQALLADVDKNVNQGFASTRPRMSLIAVHLLKARVSLYGGLFGDAITSATAGIALAPALANTQTAFSGMYNQTSAGEIIWNVQFDAGQSGPTYIAFWPNTNRSYFRPALEVATIDGTTGLVRNNDLRYAAYFGNFRMSTEVPSVPQALALTKYRGKGTVVDGNANFIAMKTAELYLIRAEAYARATPAQEGLAMADLNTLRKARISSYVDENLTGATLINAIADERRREFVGEGHRFFDLKRTTRTLTRGSTCGQVTQSPITKCTLTPTSREWTFPITEPLINANPNLVQNPSWK
jgi:hypothetical protein